MTHLEILASLEKQIAVAKKNVDDQTAETERLKAAQFAAAATYAHTNDARTLFGTHVYSKEEIKIDYDAYLAIKAQYESSLVELAILTEKLKALQLAYNAEASISGDQLAEIRNNEITSQASLGIQSLKTTATRKNLILIVVVAAVLIVVLVLLLRK